MQPLAAIHVLGRDSRYYVCPVKVHKFVNNYAGGPKAEKLQRHSLGLVLLAVELFFSVSGAGTSTRDVWTHLL